MSRTTDSDHEDPMVDLHTPLQQTQIPSYVLSAPIAASVDVFALDPTQDDSTMLGEMDVQWCHAADPNGKGKMPTRPVAIGPPAQSCDSPSSSAASMYQGSSSRTPLSDPVLASSESPNTFFDYADVASMDGIEILYTPPSAKGSAKGKEKDIPPSLPPLSFSQMELSYDQNPWPTSASISSTSGPSSCGSIYSTMPDMTPSAPSGDPITSPAPSSTAYMAHAPPGPSLRRAPSRRRSLSNLSLRSTPSFASLSMAKIKVKLSPPITQSNLARRLGLGKSSTPSFDSVNVAQSPTDAGTASSLSNSTAISPAPLWCETHLQYDLDNTVPQSVTLPYPSLEKRFKLKTSRLLLKGKGRSNSSPAPFSALDFVPVTNPDVFEPLPLLRRNYFDHVCPKELRIHIMKLFVQLYEEDHARAVANGRWTITKATSFRHRHVGRDCGIRELFKLRRVSRSWQSLVFDGQLWLDLDLHSFPGLPKSILLQLTRVAGPFVQRANFAGHAHLQSAVLSDITSHLCLKDSLSYTHLTTLNLQGCSALTTLSLHHLLARSRYLQTLCLKGLTMVTNATCELLAAVCTRLTSLNLSRCPNVNADGIRSLAQITLSRGECLKIKELRISGLKYMDDETMRAIGMAAPLLEVLDLSYIHHLHNSALEAFVSVEEDKQENCSHRNPETVRLTARQVGRDVLGDNIQFYTRRVTKLRHLSVSFCHLLTDDACSNIAHAVPQLEFLEMAGIGAELRDPGLVRLLNTTPLIRRLDLEDASEITDAVLAAITPTLDDASQTDSSNSFNYYQPKEPTLQPGQALEWLVISHAANITDAALLRCFRSCPKLRILEADNTRLTGFTVKEFVNQSRQRNFSDAKVVAIDCRSILEPTIKELGAKGLIRPRLGIRAFWARKLAYVDGSDEFCEDDLKVGHDECDPRRVVVKTFYSWQTVDAVRSAREKRRRASSRRVGNSGLETDGALDRNTSSGRTTGFTRWWGPSGRPSGTNTPPFVPDLSNGGCLIM